MNSDKAFKIQFDRNLIVGVKMEFINARINRSIKTSDFYTTPVVKNAFIKSYSIIQTI
jgi:hypothetical protein